VGITCDICLESREFHSEANDLHFCGDVKLKCTGGGILPIIDKRLSLPCIDFKDCHIIGMKIHTLVSPLGCPGGCENGGTC
jgi:hypothetical protein